MIIFHEGLPGSGKSYEAAVKQIIPALKKGRQVFAYIEGINHEKFAEITELPVTIIKKLLIQIERDQVTEIYQHVENDSLVVIDELQNFWPSGRQKLDEHITQFVTEHRHRGLDILCMGQDLRDCHSLWKRRVSQKVVFVNRDAVGQPDKYTWRMYKATSGEKFEKITSGKGQYEKKYFGLYKSHVDDAENTDTFNDSRANVFNTKYFKIGVPITAVMAVLAIKYLVGFFTVEEETTKTAKIKMERTTNSEVAKLRQQNQLMQRKLQQQNNKKAIPEKPQKRELIDYFDKLADKHTVRLSGLIVSENKITGYIDVIDTTFHLKERMTVQEIQSMGWTVDHKEYGLKLSKEKVTYVARPWPIDPFGRVSNNTRSKPQINNSQL